MTVLVAAIGVGSNLGDREAHLLAARRGLEAVARPGSLWASSAYETEPLGPPQPRYLNAALRLETTLDLEGLFGAMRALEAERGRVRRERWGPRTLDLDLLLAERPDGSPVTLRSDTLTVPHPELVRRAFVLAPLLEVMPHLAPTLGPALASLGGAPPRRPYPT